MKIKPEHFDIISKAINKQVMEAGGWDVIKEKYETGNFPRADNVKDLQTRMNFNLLYGCDNGMMDFICNTIYSYANDSHIETALKKICPTITRRY